MALLESARSPCERAGVHLRGTGHSQTECPTLDDASRADSEG